MTKDFTTEGGEGRMNTHSQCTEEWHHRCQTGVDPLCMLDRDHGGRCPWMGNRREHGGS